MDVRTSLGVFAENRWIEGRGESIESKSPVDGKVIWKAKASTKADVDVAFQSGRNAFRSWRQTPVEERQTIVRRFATVVQENAADLANAISRETGKPLWESMTEATAVASKVALAIEAMNERRRSATATSGELRSVVRFQPHGVMAVLGPFNLPAHLPNGHMVPALIAGNCVVLKPSELTPMVGELLIKFWEQAKVPCGVVNLIQGGRDTGECVVHHPELDGLLFTGSSRAGISINRALSNSPGKIVALEMGGNNPLIVHQCRNRKAAAYQTILSAFITSGQRCTCARRLILVKGDEANRFLDELIQLAARVRVGHFNDDPEPFMGPVISESIAEKLLESQQQLTAAGGESLLAMKLQKGSKSLLSPGVMDVTSVKQIDDEELFGPFLQVTKVDSFSEAIIEANRTRYGLAAGLISDSAELYHEFLDEIRAGIVNWNRQTTGASGKLPFGGCGLSGNHRPAGFYSADYCSYPVSSLESDAATIPDHPVKGVEL